MPDWNGHFLASRLYTLNPKESLIISNFVVPAKAGTQAIQAFLDARRRRHDGFSEVS